MVNFCCLPPPNLALRSPVSARARGLRSPDTQVHPTPHRTPSLLRLRPPSKCYTQYDIPRFEIARPRGWHTRHSIHREAYFTALMFNPICLSDSLSVHCGVRNETERCLVRLLTTVPVGSDGQRTATRPAPRHSHVVARDASLAPHCVAHSSHSPHSSSTVESSPHSLVREHPRACRPRAQSRVPLRPRPAPRTHRCIRSAPARQRKIPHAPRLAAPHLA